MNEEDWSRIWQLIDERIAAKTSGCVSASLVEPTIHQPSGGPEDDGANSVGAARRVAAEAVEQIAALVNERDDARRTASEAVARAEAAERGRDAYGNAYKVWADAEYKAGHRPDPWQFTESIRTAIRERDEALKEVQRVRECWATAVACPPALEALKKERDEARAELGSLREHVTKTRGQWDCAALVHERDAAIARADTLEQTAISEAQKRCAAIVDLTAERARTDALVAALQLWVTYHEMFIDEYMIMNPAGQPNVPSAYRDALRATRDILSARKGAT